MENSKEVFVVEIKRNMKKIDSFSVFIQRLTYSTIASASACTDVYDEERLHFSTQISRMAVSL